MPASHSIYDTIWLLTGAALVMLMQGGFCLLESGLVRAKNSINVAIKNLVEFCISGAIFWAIGFAVMFGFGENGLLDVGGFFLGREAGPWLLAFFLFQMVFCGTATTIVSGAVSERMRFTGYIAVATIASALLYPIFGQWAWGGALEGSAQGWLERLGFIDFAGSTVVHSVGGWLALAAVLVIGPRRGRFGPGSSPIAGHNLSMATLGVMLLWFGWFGFNGGSTLGLDKSIPLILVNTNLAAAFGGLVAMALVWLVRGRPDVRQVMYGVIAGLVGITAGCHLVSPLSAAVIGSVAGAVCFGSTVLLERLEIDDAIGSVPTHACAGVWGTLAVALFGDPDAWGTGLGRWAQFGVQAVGVGTCFAWSFGLGFSLFYVLNRVLPLRVSGEDEQIGLNMSEHGASTAILDLVMGMGHQERTGDFSGHVAVDPYTEVGQIANQYNRVLDKVNSEVRKRDEAMEALRHSEERLRDQALRDSLTGLPNRALITDRLAQAIRRNKRYPDYKFAVLYLDFDRFKIINDSLGHEIGDQLLIAISERLEKNLRGGDSASHPGENLLSARLGGDEFVILLDGGVRGVLDVIHVAERLQKELAAPYDLGGHEVNCTVSIGIVTSDSGYERPEEILRDADTAMYEAKKAGKAGHVVFDERMHREVVQRLHLEKELRWAVEREEFVLHYQPIVCMESRVTIGFEALIRWQHPQRGLVQPGRFVTIAEETALVVPMGHWAMSEACRQLKEWQKCFPRDPPLAVNVNLSKRQLSHVALVSDVEKLIRESGLCPSSVKLEITESMIMDNHQDLTPVLHQLRDLGVSLCMDDFGTGHSSLSCLQRFPIDVLKIDRAFIRNLGENIEFAAIIQAIVTLADTLHITVVAEGVETATQLAQLQALECNQVQGFYFSKPLPADAVDTFLSGEKSRMTAA